MPFRGKKVFQWRALGSGRRRLWPEWLPWAAHARLFPSHRESVSRVVLLDRTCGPVSR